MATTGEIESATLPDEQLVQEDQAKSLLSDLRRDASRLVGAVLAALLLVDFALHPRWPTPDLLLVVAALGFMAVGQGWALIKRLAPFSILLIVYQAFRGLVPHLNTHVHYDWMINADLWLTQGEQVPTLWLQQLLWHGSPRWYDFVFYSTYMAHFAFPVLMVILAWKLRPHLSGFVIRCYLLVTAAGFLTYVLYPAAPPWLAAEKQLIPDIARVSNHVYGAMDLAGATTLWSQVAPNPVAAVPSLHAAYATLFALLIWRLFGSRWMLAALPYPVIIFVGTVYAGEHYVIDEILGVLYAFAGYWIVGMLSRRWARSADSEPVEDGGSDRGRALAGVRG